MRNGVGYVALAEASATEGGACYWVRRTSYLASRTSLQAAYLYSKGSLTPEKTTLDYTATIKECLNGNRKAQKRLYDRFAGRMLFLCRRYAVDDNEARDMVQEGFIRVFRNLDKFRNTGPFEGWVRRIFINSAIKYYHRERHHNTLTPVENAGRMENPEADVLDSLSEKELISLLSELPDGYRVVFNLYAVEGYSHAEIAEILEIRESTSRSQLVKARKMLQVKITELQRVIL